MVDFSSIVPILPQHPVKQRQTFTCKFCKHAFLTESRFVAHECKQIKRFNEFKTPLGQGAWIYYQTWYRYSKKPTPTPDTFMNSNYFRTFINFTKFVKKVELPFPDKFIWFASEQKYPPGMWVSDAVYTLYIEYVDKQADPVDLIKQSITLLVKTATLHNVDPSAVFNVIDPYDLIHWIRVRKISPWVLLHSTAFKKYFVSNTTTEQKTILETLIRPTYWKEQFSTRPEIVNEAKKYLTQLDL